MRQKLPIGIQSFEKMRDDGFLYVDKTDILYQMVYERVPYCLNLREMIRSERLLLRLTVRVMRCRLKQIPEGSLR